MSDVNVEEVKELLSDIETFMGSLSFRQARVSARTLMNVFPGAASACLVFNNSLTSIEEGLSNKDISKKTASREFAESLDALKQAVEKQLAALHKRQLETDLKMGITTPPSTESYQEERLRLQKAIESRGFVLTRSYALPISSPPLSQEGLKSIGIKSENFSGYVILKDQLILGLSRETIKERGGDPDVVAESAINAVRSKYKSLDLIQACPPYSWDGTLWYWLIPSSFLRIFRKATISPTTVQSIAFKKWSFPWN